MAMSTSGLLTEVPVAAAVPQATPQRLTLLAKFFDTNPATRVTLGHFLAARDEQAGHADIEGTITAAELTEAADLLRA